MKTYGQQTSLFTEERLTFLPEDSHVSPTAQQEKDLGRQMCATCGQKSVEQFMRFNHPGSFQKTFAALLIGMEGWYSTRCVLTWKLKATKFSRFYFLLQVSMPRTGETESSLLPTPTASELTGGPRTVRGKRKQNKNGQNWSAKLQDLAKSGLLPTPTASSDVKGGCTRKDPERQKDTLAHAIHGIVGQTGKTSQLNAQFVAEMMGFPPDWCLSPFLQGEAVEL